MNSRIVIGLGELLWDMFPLGKKLGGAPANFAYISSLLGDKGVVASRVGQDDLGQQAISCVKALGGETGEIQTDPIHPTGTVEVSIDKDGQAKFEIKKSVAKWLQEKFGLRLVCVTRGARGSLMIGENEAIEYPGFAVKVADTVGAGDAFTAALVHHFLRGASLAEMSEAANHLGSWVASQVGAMPVPDAARLEKLRAAGR